NPLPSRTMPTCFHISSRTADIAASHSAAVADDFAAERGLLVGLPDFDSPRLSCMALPARAPNTTPSSSELLAKRLAPWTPLQAASPAANKPGRLVRPSRSVRTPPIA